MEFGSIPSSAMVVVMDSSSHISSGTPVSSRKPNRKEPKAGDLIEIKASRKSPAYVAKLNGNRPVSSLYVPTSIIGVWLGVELIDLGVDHVECDVFLYEGKRHVIINGSWKKLG